MNKDERKSREYEQRRAHILACAEEIFAAKGFQKATMVEIATASGFATGSLYQFFDNKEDLFVTMISECLETSLQGVVEAVALQKDSNEKIKAFIDAQLSSLSEKNGLLKMLSRGELVAIAITTPHLREVLLQKTKQYIALVEGILHQGIIEKAFREDLDEHTSAKFLLGGIRFFIFHWLVTGQSFDIEKEVIGIQKTFIQGVGKR